MPRYARRRIGAKPIIRTLTHGADRQDTLVVRLACIVRDVTQRAARDGREERQRDER
jgi:hypothetical protein